MIRCRIYVDGDWLSRNLDKMARSDEHFRVDFFHFPYFLADKLKGIAHDAHSTGVDLQRAYFFGTIPDNVNPSDTEQVERKASFYDSLGERGCFDTVITPVDYRGFHLYHEDRHASDDEAERRFYPDSAQALVNMGAHMAGDAAADRMDVAIVVTGDGTLIPAMQAVRREGKRVMPVVIYGATAYELLNPSYDMRVADFPVLRLNEFSHEFELGGRRESTEPAAETAEAEAE